MSIGTLSNVLQASSTQTNASIHQALVAQADSVSTSLLLTLAGAMDCGLTRVQLASERLNTIVLVDNVFAINKMLPLKLEPGDAVGTTSTAGATRRLSTTTANDTKPSVILPSNLLINDGTLDRYSGVYSV
jgi:hypothetical protein